MQNHKITAIWGVRLLDEGFTQIPNLLIRNYRKLGIEHGEFGLICTILTYKYDTSDPHPSIQTLAEHMNVNTRQIDKWIKSLKNKGLIRVGHRVHADTRQFAENVYNFKPLINKLMELLGEEPLPESQADQYDVVYDDEPYEPEVRMEPSVPEDHDPSVPEVRKPYVPEVPDPYVLQVHNKIHNENTYENTSIKYKTETIKKKKNRSMTNLSVIDQQTRRKYRDPRYSRFYQLFPDC
jgi:hypothetical protein